MQKQLRKSREDEESDLNLTRTVAFRRRLIKKKEIVEKDGDEDARKNCLM